MDPVFTPIIAVVAVFGGGLGLKGFESLLARSKDTGSIAAPETKELTDYQKRWQDPKYVAMIHKTRAQERDLFDYAYTECECEACTTPPVGCGFHGCGASGCEKFCQGRGTKKALPKPPIARDRNNNAGNFCKEPFCKHTVTGFNTYCYKHRDQEVKTHTVFTKAGPKKVTTTELDNMIAKARRLEAEQKKIQDNYRAIYAKYEARIFNDNNYYKRSPSSSMTNCVNCGKAFPKLITPFATETLCRNCREKIAPKIKTTRGKR